MSKIAISELSGGLLVVDSRLIAEQLGIEHRAFLQTLKKHQDKIEQRFGAITFEMREFQTSQGNKAVERYAFLTEPQATVLMTFSKNTPQVVECKLALVEAFEKAKVVIKTVVPAQNDRIRELELALELEKARTERMAMRKAIADMHGVHLMQVITGDECSNVAPIDRKTIEIIDPRSNSKYEGQSLTQIKEYLHQRFGVTFKSGADIKRWLEAKRADYLLGQAPKTVLIDYAPTENLEEVYRILLEGDRQILIGEVG